jgi:AraC-like DNA-binding protein
MSEPAYAADPLVEIIARYARIDGDFATPIPGLYFYRRSKVSAPLPCVYGLGLGVGVQGKKRLVVDGHTLENGPGLSILTTIDVPVVAQISEASSARPFLGLLFKLDASLIAQTSAELELPPVPRVEARGAMSLQPLENRLGDAVRRLVMLLEEPEPMRAMIASLIEKEIYIRLLTGSHGRRLREFIATGSPNQHIARVVSYLKQNFRNVIRMDDLAAYANMSPSTFRQHFRVVCGMSPLQFQKRLRLQEARQILLAGRIDAAEAASLVGYESVSQFTREYRRLFGNPPLKDVKLQQEGLVVTAYSFP